MCKETVYRITFSNQDTVYDVYAKKVCESAMFGFIEIEDFIFGETTSLVVDPSEERLKLEFGDVKRTYIPMHTVIRIDEVTKEGVGKVKEFKSSDNKVSMFPTPLIKKDQ